MLDHFPVLLLLMSIHPLPCHIFFAIPVLLIYTLQARPLWRPSSACSRISALSGARSSSARRSSSSGSSGRSSSSSSTGCGSAIVREVRVEALAYPNESVFEERLFVWILSGLRIRIRENLDLDPHWSQNSGALKGLSHEIDFKNVDENGQILAILRAAAGFWIFRRLLWFLVEIKHHKC